MTKIVKDAPRLIDEAFEKAPDFAKPIIYKLREIVHSTCPEIKEDWKWGPNFNYHGMVCGIWYFKKHASITFFNGADIHDKYRMFTDGMANEHNRNIKYTSADQIRTKELKEYIKQACANNKKGIKPLAKKAERTVELPDYLKKIFKQHPKAAKVFDALTFTERKEYVVSIAVAKKEETRERRILKMLEKLEK